jgi:hypothetical protein
VTDRAITLITNVSNTEAVTEQLAPCEDRRPMTQNATRASAGRFAQFPPGSAIKIRARLDRIATTAA